MWAARLFANPLFFEAVDHVTDDVDKGLFSAYE